MYASIPRLNPTCVEHVCGLELRVVWMAQDGGRQVVERCKVSDLPNTFGEPHSQ